VSSFHVKKIVIYYTVTLYLADGKTLM